MNRTGGVHFNSPGDDGHRDELMAQFRREPLEELVHRFNREVRLGITGVRMQLVYIAALNEALGERTGENTLDQQGPLLRPLRYLSIDNGKLVQHAEN